MAAPAACSSGGNRSSGELRRRCWRNRRHSPASPASATVTRIRARRRAARFACLVSLVRRGHLPTRRANSAKAPTSSTRCSQSAILHRSPTTRSAARRPATPTSFPDFRAFPGGGGLCCQRPQVGSRDLIALSIGGNDQAQFNSANSIAQIQALATTSASNAATGVQQLIALGAHNIAWVSPGNPFYFPAPFGDPATTPAQRAAWKALPIPAGPAIPGACRRADTRIFLLPEPYQFFRPGSMAHPAIMALPAARGSWSPWLSGLPRGLDGGPEQLFLLGRHSSDQCGLRADRPLHGQPDGCAAHRGAASRRGARNGDEL